MIWPPMFILNSNVFQLILHDLCLYFCEVKLVDLSIVYTEGCLGWKGVEEHRVGTFSCAIRRRIDITLMETGTSGSLDAIITSIFRVSCFPILSYIWQHNFCIHLYTR